MAFDVLYVSPHSDDVAFSAAAQVARDRGDGRRVGLITLFEAPQGAGPDAFSNQATRRDEDDRYAALSGVTRVAGGWIDAIARRRRYRAPRRLFAPLPADEAPLIDEVRARLQALVDGGCRRVVAPLGVGHHVDHQVAQRAAAALTGAEVWFYEDAPYVLTRYQLPRRLARLGWSAAPADGDETLARGSVRAELRAAARTWMDAPFMRALVGGRQLRKVAVATVLPPELLRWPRPPRHPRAVATAEVLRGAAVAKTKLAAVACYASQWPLFFPSLDGWRAALADYSRLMGHAGIVERRWRIAPV